MVVDRMAGAQPTGVEESPLEHALGRVLAQDVFSERDSPPLDRSMRDGFAVKAADMPGPVRIVGEVAAGQRFAGIVSAGETVEIMTGAPVPEGADSVVMVEHCQVIDGRMSCDRPVERGQNINPRAADCRQGDLLLRAGARIRPQEVALLASNGLARVEVYRRPRVAIIATGDELVGIESTPLPHQIRNSNGHALASQVIRAGGQPWILPVAGDTIESTLPLILEALEAEMMLLSGGVSAGKHDVVERALSEAGAQFHFDRVLIQPGQPLVFGHARGKPFFGLPGNPASTLVCFELFARAALEALSGCAPCEPPMSWATLKSPFSHKPGLTRFLPAQLDASGAIEPVPWSGSGDIPALTRANCFLVADPDKPVYEAGDWIQVLYA